MNNTRSYSRVRCWAAALCLWLASAVFTSAQDLVVFAAASLKTALDEIAADYETATGQGVVTSYAGSSVLARQIGFGAPADVFISASPDWMDVLERENRIDPVSRIDLLGNSLVLIASGRDVPPVALTSDLRISDHLKGGRLAMALVDAVPAGVYGKAGLEYLGLWSQVRPVLAQTDNVRAALTLVATGAASWGVVYATDAAASDNVTVIAEFPEKSHPPIVYPAALVTGAQSPAAAEFLAYLRAPDARAAFQRQGFAVLVN